MRVTRHDVLTPRQEERRRRVIQAALRLGSEGGYEAVQMRDVARTAGVALGTIYRYFSSKDHLLAEAMAEWTHELRARVRRTPPRGAGPADRMVDVLRRACRALEREPALTAALVKALGSSDDGVGESARAVGGQISEMADDILTDFDPDARDGIIRVLWHVWYSTLVAWANGQMGISQVADELEAATRLLVSGPGARPNGRRG